MNLEHLFRAFGRALGEALAENGKFEFRTAAEDEGVPLAELDLTGAQAHELKLALSRTDVVRVALGDALAIEVEGDEAAREALRFRLADERLTILRRHGGTGAAAIKVTMAAPRKLVVAGAGSVSAEGMASEARVAIGGSGNVRVDRLAGTRFEVRIGGSGTVVASGAVDSLDLSIGGSGDFDAPALEVRDAEIRIGGSGKVEYSSDGTLEAKIGGSGSILVHGAPRCSLKAGGSGKLRCVPRAAPEATPQAA